MTIMLNMPVLLLLVASLTTTSATSTTSRSLAVYKPTNVSTAWDNHFSAFGGQDLDKIMLDYDNSSVLKAYDFTSKVQYTHVGEVAIRGFFAGLFTLLSDLSGLTAPTVEVTEAPNKQVYLIWTCPTSGITSAQDTFIYTDAFKISRQNIAYTAAPACPAVVKTDAAPRTAPSMLVAAACVVAALLR